MKRQLALLLFLGTAFVFPPFLAAQTTAPPAAPQAPVAPRTVLFPIVSNCVANQDGTPQCAFVDAKDGYVILKDTRGESQLLLVATARRWGMEDPHIEASDEPNYFEEAWSARRCVTDANGRPAPDSEIGIVINSKYGRSDGQLHLHIDLLKPGIAEELHQRFPHPGGVYKKRNETASFFYSGHPYAIAHYEALHGHNLFADLQHNLQRGDEMANHSIMVIEDPAGGFFVLNDRAHGTDRASGEELQVAHTPLPPEHFAELAARARTCMAGAAH